jgi:hypothetical protein
MPAQRFVVSDGASAAPGRTLNPAQNREKERLREYRGGCVMMLRAAGLLAMLVLCAGVACAQAPEGEAETIAALGLDPGQGAGPVLREALLTAEGNARIAVINLLGKRRDAEAVPVLCAIANGSDLPAACAAVCALGEIGTGAAANCLANRLEFSEGTVRKAAIEASLHCAEALVSDGNRDRAMAIYTELAGESYPADVRAAANLGLRNRKLGPPLVLFDGENLEHWEGNLELWRVENGAIVGGSLESPVRHNDFLCTKEHFSDFELRLQVKLSDPEANAGIQIRSQREPGSPAVRGYQADMGQKYWGCLYDEHRRNEILVNADQAVVRKIIDLSGWNEYTILCDGGRIQLWMNGHLTADYTEPDDAIPRDGIIGLQIHSGPPSQAYYRNIVLRRIVPLE